MGVRAARRQAGKGKTHFRISEFRFDADARWPNEACFILPLGGRQAVRHLRFWYNERIAKGAFAMRNATIGLAAILFAAAQLNGQQPGARLDNAFESIEAAVKRGDVPGATALVARQGKIVREEAFGLSDVENKTAF